MKATAALVAFVVLSGLASAEDLKLPNGKVLKSFHVYKVEPDGLRISHEAGVSKVSVKDLPRELVRKYLPDYDSAKAEQFKQETQEANMAALAEAQRQREEPLKAEIAASRQAAERDRLTPRLTTTSSVKGYWMRNVPVPAHLQGRSGARRFEEYLRMQIGTGAFDLEAEATALEWNVREFRRVGQTDQADALERELERVDKKIEQRDRQRQIEEIAAMRAELELANIQLEQLNSAMQDVAFQLMLGNLQHAAANGQTMIYWKMR